MSDWADNTDNTYQVDQPAPTPGGDFVPTPLDSSTYDSINTYADYVSGIYDSIGGGSDANAAGWTSSEGGAGYSGGQSMDVKPGSGAAKIDTGSGKNWLDSLLHSFKNDINWEDSKVQVAAGTIAAGALGGIGKAILDSPIQKRKLDLEEKKISTEAMLAQTQADIAKQKMANQAGALTFNAPVDANGRPIGLINRVAKFTPLKNRVTP